ncbi:MAG: site-specific DNA-methyltransferase [Thermoplasmata archaeon]|nr:site-specific DNA-methyltransferase [Thermoplasmata archaeon]
MPGPVPFARLVGPNGAPVVLYEADSVRTLPKLLAKGSVDCVVTSPPYNRKVAYGSYDDDLPRAEYLRWVGSAADSVRRVLAPAGSFFLNVGGSPTDPWLPWDVAREVGRRFALQNVVHWVKSIAIDRELAGKDAGLTRDLAVGHYKPLNSKRYLHSGHEYVFHFTHRGDVELDRLAVGVAYQDPSNVDRWRSSGSNRRCRGNTWFLPYRTIRFRSKDRPHPAAFPVELPERCFRLHGVGRLRLAVDPFVGIGSSAVAAVRLGIPFVGFDVDPEYLATAETALRAAGAIVPPPTPSTVGERRRNPSLKYAGPEFPLGATSSGWQAPREPGRARTPPAASRRPRPNGKRSTTLAARSGQF